MTYSSNSQQLAHNQPLHTRDMIIPGLIWAEEEQLSATYSKALNYTQFNFN